jgi:hypothetical protein
MAEMRRYAEELRALGQALDAKGVVGFELYRLAAGYFVKDLRENMSSSRWKILNWLRGQLSGKLEFVTYAFEPRDLEELSKAGRARRSKPDQVPRFRDPSNILRTIGGYIDAKEVELLELHKRPISVTLAYRDRSGHEYREDRPISSFQPLFTQLREKRGRSSDSKKK